MTTFEIRNLDIFWEINFDQSEFMTVIWTAKGYIFTLRYRVTGVQL